MLSITLTLSEVCSQKCLTRTLSFLWMTSAILTREMHLMAARNPIHRRQEEIWRASANPRVPPRLRQEQPTSGPTHLKTFLTMIVLVRTWPPMILVARTYWMRTYQTQMLTSLPFDALVRNLKLSRNPTSQKNQPIHAILMTKRVTPGPIRKTSTMKI